MKEKIANLTVGQVLLVKAIKTNDSVTGTGYQLEFAEKIQARGVEGVTNLLQLFNADDQRFGSGARRAWLKTTPVQAASLLNINLGDDANWIMNPETGKEELELGILNPTVNGMDMRIRVTESTVPFSDYQRDNVEKAAKRKGKEGDYIFHKGKHIFSNTEVVGCKEGVSPEHTFLTPDPVSVPANSIVDETLGGLI
jgi:hypothetical protein